MKNALVALISIAMMSFAAEKARGYLIAVEGGDRCGKSTQCFLAKEWLEAQTGRPVEYWKFPERTWPTGKLINSYLTGELEMPSEAIHLLFSANRWELKQKLEDTLASGTSIILDRYVYSGVAYSAAKGLDLEWCKSPDHGLPQPDIILFIDLPPEVAQQRAGYGQERYEKVELQTKVRKNFGILQQASGTVERWKVIDGNRSVEDLQVAVQEELQRSLLTQPLGPLTKLNWLN